MILVECVKSGKWGEDREMAKDLHMKEMQDKQMKLKNTHVIAKCTGHHIRT